MKHLKLRGFNRDSVFLKDTALTALAQVAVMVLALVVNKLMSAYLAPEGFTIFTIANKAAGVIAFVMLFGLGIALPRYIAKIRTADDRQKEANFLYASAMILLAISGLIALVLALFGDAIAYVIFSDQRHADLVWPMFAFAFGIAASTFLHAYLRGADKFKQYSITQIALSLVSVVIVVLFGANVAGQFVSRGVVMSVLAFLVLAAVVFGAYKKVKPIAAQMKKYTKEILLYCAPRVPGEFILFAYTVAPLVVINTKFGPTVSAAFAIAITLNLAVAPLFQFVGTVLLPYVSKNFTKGNSEDISRKVSKLRAIYVAIGLLSTLFVLFFTNFVIRTLFTSDYEIYADTVRIVYLSVLPYAIYLLLRNPIDAASVFPFNTINLAISFSVLMVIVTVSENLLISSIAFPLSYSLLALLTEYTWRRQMKTIKDD